MLKIVIGLVLLAHGIGHSMGLLQLFRVAVVNPTWKGDSWLLTGVAGSTVSTVVGATIWIAAIIGFAALAGVVFGWLPAAWWQPLAIGSAVVSLAGLVLYPMAFPPLSSIGALAVDVLLLVAVVWASWMPSELSAS
jgi:hypothetical protein